MHKTPLGISLRVLSSSASRRIMRRIGMALLGLVVVLLALAVAGAIYQAIATELAERAYPPPGEMVGVGGYRLHINCVGAARPWSWMRDRGVSRPNGSGCSGRSPVPHV